MGRGTAFLFLSLASSVVLLARTHADPAPAIPPAFVQSGSQTFVKPLCGSFPGLRTCADLIPELAGQITANVQKTIDNAYAGKLINPGPTGPQGTMDPASFIQTPICDLTGLGEGTLSPANPTNHLGQNCNAGGAPGYCALACPADPKTGALKCEVDPTAKTCSTERAFMRGGLIRLVQFERDQVIQELQQQNQIEVHAGCDVIPKDPSQQKNYELLKANLMDWNSINGNRPLSCGASPAPVAGAPGPSPSPTVLGADGSDAPEQAACYLSSARTAMELLLASVGSCEAFMRANNLWNSPAGKAQLVGVPYAAASAAFSACLTDIPGQITEPKLQACYAVKYPKLMRDQFTSAINALMNGGSGGPLIQ